MKRFASIVAGSVLLSALVTSPAWAATVPPVVAEGSTIVLSTNTLASLTPPGDTIFVYTGAYFIAPDGTHINASVSYDSQRDLTVTAPTTPVAGTYPLVLIWSGFGISSLFGQNIPQPLTDQTMNHGSFIVTPPVIRVTSGDIIPLSISAVDKEVPSGDSALNLTGAYFLTPDGTQISAPILYDNSYNPYVLAPPTPTTTNDLLIVNWNGSGPGQTNGNITIPFPASGAVTYGYYAISPPLSGQLPEIPLAGILPTLCLAGTGAWLWKRRRQAPKV